jgi:hypothetical protein
MTGSAQGQPVRGSWAIYSKPPRLRGDISVTAGGRTEAYSTYLLSDGAVICQLGGTPRCQTVSRDALEQQAPAQQIDALLRRNPDDFEVAYEGSRRVVGLLGFCYEVRPKPAVQVGFTGSHFCYAADGVMLLGLVRSAQGEVDFEATEVSRAVADSDLEPPAR